ncbi:MAG: hypothetical protein ACTSVY_00040 [Candidatus Helarchaeota archaeon]
MGLQTEKISVTPAIIWEKNSQAVNLMDLEIASFFALTEYFRLTHEKLKNSEYIIFSKTLWPITLVQNGPEDYIVVDGLNFYLFQFSLTKSPTTIQSKISRFLRDAGTYGAAGSVKIEDFLKNLITTNELIQDIGKQEETIKGIIEPDVIKGLAPLIKMQYDQPISQVAVIDSVFLTDEAIAISDKFRNLLTRIDGNIKKWRELDELIVSITDNWLINILKDIEDKKKRFELEIRRKETEVKSKLPSLQRQKSQKFMELSEWNVKERRKLASSFMETIVPIFDYFEEVKSRLNDIRKETDPEEIYILLEKAISELESGTKIKEILTNVRNEIEKNKKNLENLNEQIKTQEKDINAQFEEKLSSVGKDLPAFKEERDKIMKQHMLIRSELENLTNTIRNSITRIISNCNNEQNYIKRWTIPGNEVNLVMPISKIYVPLYFAEIENDEGEEKFIISPPIIIPRNFSLDTRWVPFEFINRSFSPLIKERLETVLENNFELRSKFEFGCENKNLFLMDDINRRIQRGFDLLIKEKLMDDLHVNEIKNNWAKFREKLNK